MIRFLFVFFSLHLVINHVAGSTVTKTFVEGQNGSLPCSTKPPNPGDTVTLVLWYKDGSESPIYGLDARIKNKGSEPAHFVQGSLEGRSFFNMENKMPTLDVTSIGRNDQGVYRCRVDFAMSRTINYYIKVQIIIPPQEVTIKSEDGRVMSDIIGPYQEGDDILLRCDVLGGSPKPELIWKINGEKVTNFLLEEEQMKNDEEKGTMLVIRKDIMLWNLGRKDLGKIFTCQSNNNDMVPPISTTVKLLINLIPVTIDLWSSRETVLADDSAVISCKAIGSNPPAVINWFLNDKELREDNDGMHIVSRTDKNSTSSVLNFVPGIAKDGAVVSCVAHNPNLPTKTLQKSLKLSVHYAPIVDLRIKSHPDGSWIREGVDVLLECLIKSNPQSLSIQWYFNDKETSTIADQLPNVLNEGNYLIIQKSNKVHTGMYRCIAQNDVGTTPSQEVYVEVKYSPRCQNHSQVEFGVGLFKNIGIKCKVDSIPAPISFDWELYRNGQSFRLGTAYSKMLNMTSILTYEPTSMQDFGELLCYAMNDIGYQEQPCRFNLIHTDFPDPVTNCSVNNITVSSISIECIPGYDGGLAQIFHAEVFRKWTHVLQANVSLQESPSFTIENLPIATSFLIIISASNDKGKSHPVTVLAETLKESSTPLRGSYRTSISSLESNSGEAKTMKFSPANAVLIGIFCTFGFFAILIIIIIVVMISSRRSKAVSKGLVIPKQNIEEDNDKYDNNKCARPLLSTQSNEAISNVYDANANKQRLNNDLRDKDVKSKKKINTDNINEKKDEDITYAELCFPPSVDPLKINCRDSPTEYAKIIVRKKNIGPETANLDDEFCESSNLNVNESSGVDTPLICIHIESSV